MLGGDGVILGLLLVRLILLLIYEFVHPIEFLLFLIDLFHVLILTIMFYIFTKNLLREKKGMFFRYKIYTAVFVIISLGLLIVGIIRWESNFQCKEEFRRDHYVVYVTKGFELFLASLNLLWTIIIIRRFKENEDQITKEDKDVVIYEQLGEKKDAKIQRYRMRVLSRGLFAY